MGLHTHVHTHTLSAITNASMEPTTDGSSQPMSPSSSLNVTVGSEIHHTGECIHNPVYQSKLH